MNILKDAKEKLQESIKEFCEEMGLDKDIYLELLSGALVDIKQDMVLLRSAIAGTDLQKIQEISHRLKGTTGNLRLKDISVLFTELNDLSKKNLEIQKYPILCAQIEDGIKEYGTALGSK